MKNLFSIYDHQETLIELSNKTSKLRIYKSVGNNIKVCATLNGSDDDLFIPAKHLDKLLSDESIHHAYKHAKRFELPNTKELFNAHIDNLITLDKAHKAQSQSNPIQKTIKPYKKSRYDNEICDALQIHRHTGHDIFGITQFPVLLHPNFRAVVGMHHHLHRGWGLSSATIFNWAYCVDSPNAPSNKQLAEHTERFNYDKSVYKYYKSATIHTHKKRIPKNLFFIIFGVILFGYFAVKMLFFNDNFFSKVYGVEQNSTKKNTAR